MDNHTAVPASLLRDPDLTMDEKGLLIYLLTYVGQPRTLEQIATENADGPTELRALLDSLLAKGRVTLSGDTWEARA